MQGTGSLRNDNPNRENKAEFVVIDARSRHLFKDEQGLKGSELQLVHIETPKSSVPAGDTLPKGLKHSTHCNG
jgi:hypothetical protein